MALSRVKTWISGEVLTASDLNSEFNNVLNNALSLVSPVTGAFDFDGVTVTLDAAAATTVVSSAAVSWNFTSGAKTGTPSTSGSVERFSAQTFTDNNTAGSGTATAHVFFSVAGPTLAATNASVTTTDAATWYIANAPAAGTNETLTNAYALWIDDGRVRLDPSATVVSAAGATLNAVNITSQTATITGSTNITTAAGVNFVNIGTPTLSAASALTVTNAATLYIAAAPAGSGAGPATITNAYALWVDDGNVRLDGDLQVNGGDLTTTATTFNLLNATATTVNAFGAATTIAFGAATGTTTFAGSTCPQNSQSAAYTTVAADANKHILHPTADNNARTFTIDSNANVPYPLGTMITFVNEINTLTIAITSDTMTLQGAGSTGSRTLAANGIATALKTGTTSWKISGTNLS